MSHAEIKNIHHSKSKKYNDQELLPYFDFICNQPLFWKLYYSARIQINVFIRIKLYFLLIPLSRNGEARLERAYKLIAKLDEDYFKNNPKFKFKILYSEEMFDEKQKGAKYFNFGDSSFIGKEYNQNQTPVTILNKSGQKYIFQIKMGKSNANPIPLEELFDFLD